VIFESASATGGEGEYYSNARWYDPTLGRFLTEDPARAGANWFAYVSNNPLRYIDPTGLGGESMKDRANEAKQTLEITAKLPSLAVTVVNNAIVKKVFGPELGDKVIQAEHAVAKVIVGGAQVLAGATVAAAGTEGGGAITAGSEGTLAVAGASASAGAVAAGSAIASAGLATIDTGIADLMKGREGGGGKIKRPEDPKFDPKKDTVATTEQPYMPKELKPAGEEPPPTLGGKILWAAGKILDFIDSWPRLGK